MSDLVAGLAPYFYQVAYVIPDIAKAQDWAKRMFGVKHFGVMEAALKEPDFTFLYRGRPAEASIVIALGDMRGTELELIQPLSPGSFWSDHLQTHGPGLHHICFMVPEFEPVMKHFRANGMEPIIHGATRTGPLNVEFAYFDCRSDGASYVEIIWADAPSRAALLELRMGKPGTS